MKRIRVAGYARLSEYTERSTSIERQRELIAQTATARGWTLVDTIEDVDVSASKARLIRPGLDRVRDLARAGAIDAVLVWKVDRIARSVRDLAELTEEWTALNVSLTSCTESFDTSTPHGRAMLQMLSIFAELEAATIRERVLASRAALRRMGRWAAGQPPYGYRTVDNPDGGGKVLEIEPDEAEALRWVVQEILAGASQNVCAKWLNDNGYAPRRADKWTVSALKVVLTGYPILGQSTHKDQVVRDEQGYPVQFWEPIITEEQSRQLRARISTGAAPGRKDTKGIKSSPTRLLSGKGILRCGSCSGVMYVNTYNGKAGYKCPSDECPKKVGINAEHLENYVIEEYLLRVGDQPHGSFAVDTGAPEELGKVEEALAACSVQLAGALAADDGEDEAALLTERLQALKARKKALLESPRELSLLWNASGLTYREAWEQAADGADPIGLRRELIRHAFDHITIRPAEVRGRKGLDTTRIDLVWAEGLESTGSTA